MSARTPTRRTLLRGLLGGAVVSIGLPPLEAFFDVNGKALAGGGALPKRFGLFFWGNGNVPQKWVPMNAGPDWEATELLAPLVAHRDMLTVVSGTSVKVPNIAPHTSGLGGILSGGPLLDPGHDNTFAAPSIDQVIAGAIGGDTRFRSLEIGVRPGEGVSYNGPHSLNPPESNPYLFFERVFGAGFRAPGEEAIIDPALALRRSILDAVADDAERVRARVGSADRARLDQYLTGVRELELRLARLEEDPPNLAACVRPEGPTGLYEDVDGRPPIATIHEALCDILVMALACDQTRVFSDVITPPVSNVLFPNAPDGHHNLTHDEPGDQPAVAAITLQIMQQLATLLDKLRAVEEGDGTLLDSIALMAASEVSLGRTHSLDEMPILIAGTACGALKTGFHHRAYAGENASKVLLTLIRAMGIPRAEFGAAEGRVTESISALEA